MPNSGNKNIAAFTAFLKKQSTSATSSMMRQMFFLPDEFCVHRTTPFSK